MQQQLLLFCIFNGFVKSLSSVRHTHGPEQSRGAALCFTFSHSGVLVSAPHSAFNAVVKMKLSHNWKTNFLYLIFSLWMVYAIIQGVNKIIKNYDRYRKFQPIGSSITDVRLRQYPVAYSLVLFCNKHLPNGAGILFIGNGADFVRFSYYLYPRWSNVVFGGKGAVYDRRHFEKNDIRFVIVDKQESPVVKDTQLFADTNGFTILRTYLDK